MTVLVVLFWVASGLREEQSLNLLGGIFVGLAMVSSVLVLARAARHPAREPRRSAGES